LSAGIRKNEDEASEEPSPENIDIQSPDETPLFCTAPKTETKGKSKPHEKERDEIRIACQIVNDHRKIFILRKCFYASARLAPSRWKAERTLTA
jgi:hypothetical protein